MTGELWAVLKAVGMCRNGGLPRTPLIENQVVITSRPRELVGHLQERLHDPDPTGDRLVIEVAAQLLVAPPFEHFLDGLRLRMQQRMPVSLAKMCTRQF